MWMGCLSPPSVDLQRRWHSVGLGRGEVVTFTSGYGVSRDLEDPIWPRLLPSTGVTITGPRTRPPRESSPICDPDLTNTIQKWPYKTLFIHLCFLHLYLYFLRKEKCYRYFLFYGYIFTLCLYDWVLLFFDILKWITMFSLNFYILRSRVTVEKGLLKYSNDTIKSLLTLLCKNPLN